MQSAESSPVPQRRSGVRFLLIVFLLAAAFGGGYVPQWLEARKLRAELTTCDLQLRLANSHRLLGLASHEAQRSNYASAAEAARLFFETSATLARTETFEDEPRTRVALLGYIAQRDELMALLAAGDPISRDQLANLYLTMDGVLARRP